MRRQPIEEEICSNSKEKHKYNQFLCSFDSIHKTVGWNNLTNPKLANKNCSETTRLQNDKQWQAKSTIEAHQICNIDWEVHEEI